LSTPGAAGWWARGLLFENCSCTAVCPGHVHFSQDCTHERCVGYWALRFDDGEIDGVALGGVNALIFYDSPQRMIDGGWVERIVVDERAGEEQRRAVETILSGKAGGPWEVLARFVGRRLETRTAPIAIEDEPTIKKVRVPGLVESAIEAIRGRDRAKTVTFDNMFNQIHAPAQVIARGSTRTDDDEIRIDTEGTHGLWSSFEWRVPARA
jgi:hypothetical protein